MAPPRLMEELVEEILLRFPPHEPARLVHAALVCKRWGRLISGPGFRRRFRELHRTPPMLGFLCCSSSSSLADSDDAFVTRFVPTAGFSPPHPESGSWVPLDARHGRVLLYPTGGIGNGFLVVWDPITDEKRKVPLPEQCTTTSWTAAVLCSAATGACDHLDCHRGPFLVVFLGSHPRGTFIRDYASGAATWSEPIFAQQTEGGVSFLTSSVLVGNALYVKFVLADIVLKYDLDLKETSEIGMPPKYSCWETSVLTATEDGALGLATIHKSRICMWSRKGDPEVDAGWIQSRVIQQLEMLLPPDDAIIMLPKVVGLVHGANVIFLLTDNVLYTIDLKTSGSKAKKICEGRDIYTVVPYMSFYTPALGAVCTGEESSA